MGNSVERVILGWICGFLAALAWNASHAQNAQLAATFLTFALIGIAVLGLMLVAAGMRERAQRREEQARGGEDAEPPVPVAADVGALAEAGAARIAALEARLAVEQQELETTIEAMAAADAAAAQAGVELADPATDPQIREQVIDAVAGLVGSGKPRRANDVVRDVETLLEDAS
jgi:hypothetical protein